MYSDGRFLIFLVCVTMDPFLSDPFFYLCAIPAVLFFGLGKGGFGGAMGIVSVPLMSFVIAPPQAAAILLPILCVMDALAVKKYWGQWHRQNLIILLPAAMVGIALGAFTFHLLSDDWIRIMVGVIAVGFSGYLYIGSKYATQQAKPSPMQGRLWGTVAGFTSFGIHAGGPPVSIYLLPQRLPPKEFVATSALLFAGINYAKLIPYYWLGQLDTENVFASLILLPFAPVGVWLGFYLHDKVSVTSFYKVIYLFLILAGLKLLHDGITGLLAI